MTELMQPLTVTGEGSVMLVAPVPHLRLMQPQHLLGLLTASVKEMLLASVPHLRLMQPLNLESVASVPLHRPEVTHPGFLVVGMHPVTLNCDFDWLQKPVHLTEEPLVALPWATNSVDFRPFLPCRLVPPARKDRTAYLPPPRAACCALFARESWATLVRISHSHRRLGPV